MISRAGKTGSNTTEEKKLIPNEEKVELSDERLDNVTGGLLIQPDGEWTCSKCGKEFNSYDERMRHEVTCRG